MFSPTGSFFRLAFFWVRVLFVLGGLGISWAYVESLLRFSCENEFSSFIGLLHYFLPVFFFFLHQTRVLFCHYLNKCFLYTILDYYKNFKNATLATVCISISPCMVVLSPDS